MTCTCFNLVGVRKYTDREGKSEKRQAHSSLLNSIKWLAPPPCCKGSLHFSLCFSSVLHFLYFTSLISCSGQLSSLGLLPVTRFSRAKVLRVCSPDPAALVTSGNLLEMQILWGHSTSSQSESGVGPSEAEFNELCRWWQCMLNFENTGLKKQGNFVFQIRELI